MNDVMLDRNGNGPPAASLQADAAGIRALLGGRLGDPFRLLGPHRLPGKDGKEGESGAGGDRYEIRVYQPGALGVEILARGAKGKAGGVLASLQPHAGAAGLFTGAVQLPDARAYLLRVTWPDGRGGRTVQIAEDTYAFGLLLGELDIHLLREGRHRELGRCLGAQTLQVEGVPGIRFAVWAPNAQRVSVVGDFNLWDGRRHPMRLRAEAGVWEIFVPRITAGNRYKYEIVGPDGHLQPLKADPVARATELPPGTASVVASGAPFVWNDAAWMEQRGGRQAPTAPISVYEVHAGSWLRVMEENGRSLDWVELADRLIPYVIEMGFTHVEFMPIMEHPFGGSWGYQPLSQFAPSARFGAPADFARFVDRCHGAGLGVILDWVPAHFPSDAHGMARFDGTALYEHVDPREGYHQDWNTLIFNLGRNEVRGFLIASALEWLENFHVDALRVDAVASMLYRDYSREPGEWIPNIYGGRENLESVAFLKELNQTIAERCPGALMIAEESTAWPGVTAPVAQGGLGFSYKWNMGWMHDTLRYVEQDPVYRRFHHNDLTFGLLYAFSERFMLPISHDEVVHGKGSLINKMPGDIWQKLANLRAYLGFMWTHPGKKLLFMGCELAQWKEWNHDASPQWELLDDPRHRGVQQAVRDLNRLYAGEPALHARDADSEGFRWAIGDDKDNSVFAYLRQGFHANQQMLIVVNMTPVPRHGYRVPLQDDAAHAEWQEVFNSDAEVYGGSNLGNPGAHRCSGENGKWALTLTLPPLSTVIFRRTH
ncbi:1,4-alpha-glucan branching protein GlgB [Oxalobacteraceae bacterium CAVE-383]|nr:1,4-alpha-glucan branching protein GlgB [Oxalobacteraceae bacterium CAVE-383]